MLRNVKIPDLLKYCHEYELNHDPLVQLCRKTKKPSAEMQRFLRQYEAETLRLVNITIKEYRDCTPLHLAVHLGDVPTTKYLLAHGAIAFKNRDGKYPHQIELDKTHANQPDYVAKYKEARNLVVAHPAYRQSIKADQAEDRRLHSMWVKEQQQEAKRKAAAKQRQEAHQAAMNQLQQENHKRLQDQINATNRDISERREMEHRAFSKSLDKLANINQPIAVPKFTTVPFQSPIYNPNKIYTLDDCHRSGGMPTNKSSSVYLAENSLHPDYFTGFNGTKCSYNDILYANQVEMNAQEPPGMWGAAVENKVHEYTGDSNWACAPDNIQPSTCKSQSLK